MYSESEIEQSLQFVLRDHQLTADLEMSRSGTYRVVQAHGRHGAQFIIKVLRRQDDSALTELNKESTILQFLAQDTSCPLAVPAQVYTYADSMPPALAYTLVVGTSLGWYYFYVDTIDDLTRMGADTLTSALTYIQSQTNALSTMSPHVLRPKTDHALLESMERAQTAAELSGLSAHHYAACHAIATTVLATWSHHSVLVHGDFNPKNIILTPHNQVGFIDWSDAYIGGQYIDLAYFWLTCWRQPEFQVELLHYVTEPLEFWQTVCFWLPKFYALLHDAEQALIAEFDQSEIPPEAKIDNLNYIQQAKDFYAPQIEHYITAATT